MTETTDIAALREAALKATAGEWCTDSQHSVIADAGLNANYYVAACSGPDSQINASFIALANPTAIIALLDQLEAERQQREGVEAELAELRGNQEPDHYRYSCGSCGYESLAYTSKCPTCNYHKIEEEGLFTHPAKPVALPDELDFDCELEKGEGYDFDEEPWARGRVDGFNEALQQCDKLMRAAGIVVKDGE